MYATLNDHFEEVFHLVQVTWHDCISSLPEAIAA